MRRLVNPHEKASEKIDARIALDEFIVGEQSLRYQKCLNNYRRLRAQYLKDHNITYDNIKDNDPEFEKYISQKLR